jgi:YVTN family beta-propeller protein
MKKPIRFGVVVEGIWLAVLIAGALYLLNSMMQKKSGIVAIAGGISLWPATAVDGAQKPAQSVPSPALLVVNQGDKTMGIVDPAANKVVATVDEQQTEMHGHEIAVGPDGRTVYMPIYGNVGVGKPGLDGHEMIVIDLPTRTITGRVDFGHGVRPHCVVYEPVSGLLYVTTELDKGVAVIDPKTLKIVGSIPTTQEQSHMLAITRDGKRGYTANVGPGTVSVLDMVARKTVKVIPIAGMTQRIALSVDDKWVFTSDQTKPRLAVIDTATNTVAKWVELPGLGYGAKATADGGWLLVAIQEKDVVAVVDLKTMKVARTIAVAKQPQEMLIRPDGKVAYVAGLQAKQVSVIDLAQWKVVGAIDVGSYPDGLAWMK